jgi:hypothetical protein
VGAAELQARLEAPSPDDATIWLAVWLRKKELAALQAVAAELQAVKVTATANGAAAGGEGEQQQEGGGGGAGAEGEEGEGGNSNSSGTTKKAPKQKCPKVMADLVESLVAAVFIDSGCDWASTWEAAEYLLWREGVVQLPAVNLPEDPAAAAAAKMVAALAAAEQVQQQQ